MTPICVTGSVGLDRIWHLDQALRPGARLRCLAQICRMGGGAANTGTVLHALGQDPRIVARLCRDPAGDALFALLRCGGLDVAAIARVDGTTRPGDIFLQPDGERTLVGLGRAPVAAPRALLESVFPYSYLNIARLADPLALRVLLDRTCLIAQLPLDLAEPRPARVLIASRSDVLNVPATELWKLRRECDGLALCNLVITDSANGVELVGPEGVHHLPGQPIADLADSIGAGDFFAAGFIDGLARGLSAIDATENGQTVARMFLLNRPAILTESLRFAQLVTPG
jgi:sugar/nucleoside kinase (ribokinase family)